MRRMLFRGIAAFAVAVFVSVAVPAVLEAIGIKGSTVSALDRYVSTAGSDTTGDGTSGNPWKTLNKADASSVNGDVVNVAGGTYIEDNASTHGWIASKALTWNANGTVTVRGTGTTSVTVLFVQGSGTTSFNGFTIDGAGTAVMGIRVLSTAPNKNFTNMTVQNTTSAAVQIENMTNSSFTNGAISISTGLAMSVGVYDNAVISGNTITMTGGTYGLYTATNGSGTKQLTYSNNTINATLSSPFFYLSKDGVFDIHHNTATIAGKVLYATGGPATTLFHDNAVTVTTNTTNDYLWFDTGSGQSTVSGNTFISSSTTNSGSILYMRNQVSPTVDNNTIDTASTGGMVAIKVESTGTNSNGPRITNNTIRNRSATNYGIKVGMETTSAGDMALDGAVIEGNTIYGALYYSPALTGVSNHSIFVGYNKNASIRYNKVIGGAYGVVVKGGGLAYTSGSISYNEFINCVGSSSIRVKGIQNLNVHNNTVTASASYTQTYTPVLISENNAGESSTGTRLRNNIIVGTAGNTPLTLLDVAATALQSDNNILWRRDGGAVVNNNGSLLSLSSWQALGHDAASASVNPLFTNESTDNYLPQNTSRAVNSGVATGDTRDLVNATVPVGGVQDMGSLETAVANRPPTDITISNSSVAENSASGTTVGSLSATDADAANTHSYALVSGVGDDDNAKFTMTGTTVALNFVPDFEAPTDAGGTAGDNIYSVRVRVTDDQGGTFDKVLLVSVTNVVEPGFKLMNQSNSTTPTAATVVENGSSFGLRIVLADQPASDVSLTVASDNTANVTVSPTVVTFTSANWNVPQLVTISAVDDTVINSTARQATISVAVDEGSSDSAFVGLADQSLVVSVNDDDSNGVDSDGVAAAEENSVNTQGDGNGDGIVDGTQSNVASLHNPVTNAPTTVQVTGDCTTITHVAVHPESAMSAQDAAYSYPVGLNEFSLDCPSPGQQARVTFFYDKQYNTTDWLMRKFHQTLATYTTISNVTMSTVNIYGKDVTVVSYDVSDGGELDTDQTVDGHIIDPAGPATALTTETSPGTTQPTTSTGSTKQAAGQLAFTGMDRTKLLMYSVILMSIGIVVTGVALRRSRGHVSR